MAAHQSATSIGSAAGMATTAIASSSTVSGSLGILAATAMTHTATKLAAALAVVCLVPLTLQWNANARLRVELDGIQPQAAARASAAETVDLQRLAQLRSELAAKRAATTAAEAKVGELAELKRKLETEVVYSMGTVESMARELARASRVGTSLESVQSALAKAQKEDPNSEESKRLEKEMMALAGDAATLMPRGMSLVREMFKMERSPQKAARFYSTFFAESASMDEETRTQVEGRLESWIGELQRAGLAFPQRPKTIERVEWDHRRTESMTTFMNSVKADFPKYHWDDFPINQHLGSGLDSDWLDMFIPEDDTP